VKRVLLALLAFHALPLFGADWPQLQRDAARTGRTTDTVAPPYRARWIWLGPTQTLRNRDSQAGWTDNLTPSAGYSYNMPAQASFTIAESVQPVVVNNRVFIGTQEGRAYAINADDGATLWSANIDGGTVATAAASEDGSVIIFVTLTGMVYGLSAASGATQWSFEARKSITASPCVSGTSVFVADHSGRVYALTAASGGLLWTTRLPAPVLGGLAADATSVYVGAENMVVYAMNKSGGGIRAQRQVRGQSFRMLWPVVFNNIVYAHTMTTPVIGSEYVMEQLMTDSGSLAAEESNIALWLEGQGGWADAGVDWKHIFALETGGLTEPFTILAGPCDGCGMPCPPVVVDNQNRVLTYFKTRYPTLTKVGAFGTNYSIDIAAINQTNGRRIPINNGRLSNIWPWETDNLYGMTVAGNQLWLRQNFRGTQLIDLSNSNAYGVTAQVRHWDGGNFSGRDVIYKDQPPPPAANQNDLAGRVGPAVAGSRVYQTETYAVLAIERRP